MSAAAGGNHGVVYMGASAYALRLLAELLDRFAPPIVALIDTGLDEARRHAIDDALGGRVDPAAMHDAARLAEPGFLDELRAARPAVGLCAHFSSLLSPDAIACFRHGVANLHSAYLPFNRGHWPEVWSILHGTPAGITLHYIDRGIDTGPIIDQIEAPVRLEDTCASLAARIEELGIELVLRNWPALADGTAVATPQSTRRPINLHRHLERIGEIDLAASYTGKQLIDLLRALTLPRLLAGAFFRDPTTGDRIHIQTFLHRVDAREVMP